MPISTSAFYPALSVFPDAIIIPKCAHHFPFFLQLSLPFLCPLLLSLQLLLLIPFSHLFIRSQVFLIFDHCFAAGLDSPVSSLVPRVSSASFSSFLPHLVSSPPTRNIGRRVMQRRLSNRLSENRDPAAALTPPTDGE